jgi:DNA-binding transcriptional ArsR family regulator
MEQGPGQGPVPKTTASASGADSTSPPPGKPPLSMFEWQRLLRELDLPPAVKNVSGWVCSFGDQDGTRIYPGVDKLMRATGLSRDNVVEALAALRDSFLLRRVRRGGGRGSRLSDEYQVSVPDGELTVQEIEQLVAGAYLAARKGRRQREHRRYESRRNESRNRTYESRNHTYESRRRDCTNPVDTSPSNTTLDSEEICRSQAEVEGSPAAPVQDPSLNGDRPDTRTRAGTDERLRALAARQAAGARAERGAS